MVVKCAVSKWKEYQHVYGVHKVVVYAKNYNENLIH